MTDRELAAALREALQAGACAEDRQKAESLLAWYQSARSFSGRQREIVKRIIGVRK